MKIMLLLALLAPPETPPTQDATGPFQLSSTPLASHAEAGLGVQYRTEVNRVAAALHRGDSEGAEPVLRAAIDYCQSQRAIPGRRALGFQSRRQYEQWLSEHGDGTPTEWLDQVCAQASTQMGYLEVAQGRPQDALPWLQQAADLAPWYPNSHLEMGAAQIHLKRWEEALAAYLQALAIAESQPEAAYAHAMALRGVGFANIELGNLEIARASYERSLEMEPDNRIALNELEYIRRLQDRQQQQDAAR